jgi:extracellular factor (EF) 3-hydroxypalmitic acid methyl ester biosynthesis protein
MSNRTIELEYKLNPDIINDARVRILSGDFEPAFESLFEHFLRLRRTLPWEQWKEASRAFKLDPLHQLLCQCPFHGRAFSKPRGYAGDAPTLDFLYGLTPPPVETTDTGKRFFDWQYRTQSSRSVRARKDRLALAIDELTAQSVIPAPYRSPVDTCARLSFLRRYKRGKFRN